MDVQGVPQHLPQREAHDGPVGPEDAAHQTVLIQMLQYLLHLMVFLRRLAGGVVELLVQGVKKSLHLRYVGVVQRLEAPAPAGAEEAADVIALAAELLAGQPDHLLSGVQIVSKILLLRNLHPTR